MYRLLIPVDTDEERARRQAATIRSLPELTGDVEAHILHVYEEIDSPGDEGGSVYIDEVNQSLPDISGLPESIESIADALEDRGIDTEIHDVVGDPVDTILETADEIAADVILVGARSRSPVGKAVFGSVSQAVILRSDVPVLVAR